MEADELRGRVGAEVVRFIASVVLHNQAVAQRIGLGASDSQFLSLLGQHGPLTPGRLAELTGLTSGSVTGVIDRLERAGYARRERDAGDRRKVLVVLVPAAMASLGEHYREHAEHLAAVLDTRDADELRVIAAFLADVNGGAV
ncbi:MarR family winged helix-turn-helix transcriptional regulator [Pseudonocardia sp. GCM10023141]|uniref:MarR family winged helix-turn-helix transcriptional regulator n=1 Tax=Pseudonocardia sp. GCM10023141 TaxID=3252653 RepID=UPI00360E5733